MNPIDPVSEQDLGTPPASVPPAHTAASAADRRRPNRAQYSNPGLIAMLRQPTMVQDATAGEALPEESENGIDAAQGIILSVALSLFIWLGLGVLAWLVCVLWLFA